MNEGASRLDPAVSTVGIIGWGRMGSAIGRRLIEAGWTVVATDAAEEARSALAGDGASARNSVTEVAGLADLLFVVVVDDDQVRDVIAGDGGALETMRDGAIIAVCSSVRPETCRELAVRAAGRNVRLIDAALVGGMHGAATASLTLMCGGESSVLDACQPAFATFATDVCAVGPVGSGQVAKMVNNLLLWACLRADYEALELGRALGVEPGRLRPVIGAGSGANRALADWSHHNRARAGKGLQRMISVAHDHGVDVPLLTSLATIMDDNDIELDALR